MRGRAKAPSEMGEGAGAASSGSGTRAKARGDRLERTGGGARRGGWTSGGGLSRRAGGGGGGQGPVGAACERSGAGWMRRKRSALANEVSERDGGGRSNWRACAL